MNHWELSYKRKNVLRAEDAVQLMGSCLAYTKLWFLSQLYTDGAWWQITVIPAPERW